VVRSVVRIASSSAKTFAAFLMERFASDAARSSSATASDGADPRQAAASSGSSNPVGSTGAWATQPGVVGVSRTTPSGARHRSWLAGPCRGRPRLALEGVVGVAEQEIGERHSQGVMLHLPHVAELVRDEIAVGEQCARERSRIVQCAE